MQNGRNAGLIRFGVFELKKDTGELRKQGIKVRLQGKPVQLLQALLERPGEVVTREDLQKRLWPADAVVDFESGLNTAANRLRLALGDSAEHPHYVETLSRIGYRFIAPISEDAEHAAVEAPPSVETLPPAPPPVALVAPPAPLARSYPALWLILTAAIGALVLIGALALRKREQPALAFHQLTFRPMSISSARFGPDGQTIIYEGLERVGKRELYLTHPSGPESRPLGFPRCNLAAISSLGELALIKFERGSPRQLLRVPLNGGAPLIVDKGILGADWTTDGRGMAVIRSGPYSTLEYPRGKTVYQAKGWISDLRISPDGRSLAFLEHPVRGDDGGSVKLLDGSGACRTLSDSWASADGLAWAPSGREVWFTAAKMGLNRSLYAVSLDGRSRPVASFPGTLRLFDISHTGHVLVAHDQLRLAMSGALTGDPAERDLSWFDYSRVAGISEDGSVVLFDETGEGGGQHYSAYIRRADSPSAIRVGEGSAMAISPDGRWAITAGDRDRTKLNLVPLTPGETRTISGQGVTYDWVHIFPDGKRLLAGGTVAGGKFSLFTQTLDGARPQAINTTTYVLQATISPDGKLIAGVDTMNRLQIVPVEGGEPRIISLGFNAFPLRWERDSNSLLVQGGSGVPAEIFRLDINTGKYKLWKALAPPDLAGVLVISPAVISSDEKSYAYSYNRTLSELFTVDGWL